MGSSSIDLHFELVVKFLSIEWILNIAPHSIDQVDPVELEFVRTIFFCGKQPYQYYEKLPNTIL